MNTLLYLLITAVLVWWAWHAGRNYEADQQRKLRDIQQGLRNQDGSWNPEAVLRAVYKDDPYELRKQLALLAEDESED